MQSRIGNWGGSSAIRLPKQAMESLELAEGQLVSIKLQDGALLVRPAKQKYDLAEMVKQAKACSRPQFIDDGGPVGNEPI